MRICVVASYGPSLINFRGALIQDLVSRGHRVLALAPLGDQSFDIGSRLYSLGVDFCPLPLARGGLNPLADFFVICTLLRALWRFCPDCLLAYTVKPVVYSGIAVHLLRYLQPRRSIRFVAMITGLGFAFTAGEAASLRSLLRYSLQFLYRVGLRSAQVVVFQNPDDMAEFRAMRLLPSAARLERVWGSGVDLNLFPPQLLPQQPVFLMLARLLADKGVREFIEAARRVKQRYPSAVFRLAGMFDPNPAAICTQELETWIADGLIEYLGDLRTVQGALAGCRFYVLPSYREGTPRSVLEAMATGRPILTTDVPGCRETVIHGVNGFLVPPRNPDALADAMLRLIEQPEAKIQRMAEASLVLARDRFDVCKVNAQLLEVIGA